MESPAGPLASLLDYLGASPLRSVAALAAALALAFTPLAFVLLGRREYLFARRGRVYRRPEWWSVVCGMLLVMGIPAILLAFLIKSEQFDKSRYEFDPNKTFSVLDQGRRFQSINRERSVKEAFEAVRSELRRLASAQNRLQQQVASLDQASAQLAALADRAPDLKPQLAPLLSRINDLRDSAGLDTFDPGRLIAELDRTEKLQDSSDDLEIMEIEDEAVRREVARLAEIRKELVDKVKVIDDLLIPFRAASAQSATLATSLDPVLDRLSDIRRSIGLDAPQQLLVEDASPVELRRVLAALGPLAPNPVVLATSPTASSTAVPPERTPEGPGLSLTQRETELTFVPEPQRALASLLPLTNLPSGWEIGKSGERFIETFNAENLYEKIDGRAESFLQYDVRGMAYTYYHPSGDPSAEAQLYIFEMGSPLKALGKFGSEKPEEFEPVQLGAEGYSSGASVFFHAKNLYVQIVCTSDSPTFKDFAITLARRISEEVIPGSAGSPSSATPPSDSVAGGPPSSSASPSHPAPTDEPSPDLIFALLPSSSSKSNPKYVAQDVFGYSFLSDTFMADYSDGDATWQGFIRTYPSPEDARKVFEQYRAESESFGAKISELKLESADSAFQAENFGQFDLVLLKGNALAGVNGSTVLAPAVKFAEEFALKLPSSSPFLPPETPARGPEAGGESY